MTIIQTCINQIIGASLFPSEEPLELPELDAQQWRELCHEFNEQAIVGIPEPIIEKLDMPADLRETWNNTIYMQLIRFYELMNAQSEMTDLLTGHEIPCVILKGFAAACYYPKPWLRSMGDIDCIVPQLHFRQAEELLTKAGWQISGGDKDDDRHLCLEKDQIHLELHRFFSAENTSGGQALDALIFQQMTHREIRELEGFSFSMLPDAANGIVLLQHIAQHFRAGLGLRQMIDWIVYVSRCLHDSSWPAFREMTEAIGLTDLAKAAARMGQLYLGLPEEDITWCMDIDPKVCRNLLNYLYQSGNFGKKNAQDSKTVFAMVRMKHGFFRTLQRNGVRNWKAAQKFSILRPFAWIYQAFRYLFLGLQGKNTFSKSLGNIKKTKQLDVLLSDLGLQ